MLSLFLILISLIAPVSAADQKKTVDEVLGTGGIIWLSQVLQKDLPQGQVTCALHTYSKILKLNSYSSASEVGEDNKGMAEYFQNFLDKSPCFQKHAAHFFESIQDINIPNDLTPTLSDDFGKGLFKDKKPGWIWQKALEETGGNAEAAITMLGMCSASTSKLTYSSTAADKKDDLAKKLSEAKKKRDFLRLTVDSLRSSKSDETEKMHLNEVLQQFENNIQKMEQTPTVVEVSNDVICPPLLSVPQGLDSSGDISDSMKKEIAAAYEQAPEKIYAKNHHLVDAAYLGCELAKCGLPASVASFIEERAGAAYRSIILCESTREQLKTKERLEKAVGQSYLKIKPEMLMNASVLKKLCAIGKTDSVCSQLTAINDIPDKKMQNEKLMTFLSEIDASVLYRNWYLGGASISSLSIPCTDVRVLGPEPLTAKDSAKPDSNSYCDVAAWSNERCAQARKVLNVWDVDFKWTKEQHKIGAKFGAGQCSQQKSFAAIETEMCKLPVKHDSDLLFPEPANSGTKKGIN